MGWGGGILPSGFQELNHFLALLLPSMPTTGGRGRGGNFPILLCSLNTVSSDNFTDISFLCVYHRETENNGVDFIFRVSIVEEIQANDNRNFTSTYLKWF